MTSARTAAVDIRHAGLPVLLLLVGLLLPVVSVVDAAEWQYRAQRGDTPLRICRSFSRSPRCSLALASLNRLPPRAPIPPGTTVRIPAEWLKEVPIVGGVIETSTGAQYKAVDGADYAALVAGEPVYLGDTIRTTEGTVVLEFVSGLMIEVRPHSVLTLQSVVDLAESPVVNVDLSSGAATVASTGGDASGTTAPEAFAMSGPAGAAGSADEILAGAERLLEEQPTAAGQAHPAPDPVTRAMQGVLAQIDLHRGIRNTFVPAAIEWQGAADAQAWQVELLALPQRLDMAQTFVVREPRIGLPDLAAGCYQLRIRPIDAAGRVGYGSRESLCVHAPLAAPALAGAGTPTGDSVRVDWTAVDGASAYTVETAADPAFGKVLRALPASQPTLSLTPVAGQERYLRVRARNAAGMNGPASTPVALPVAPGSGDPQVASPLLPALHDS